jgi:hypothetical protein
MQTNNWPNDADGDVLRRLSAKGFDFSKSYIIDFNVDFDQWPPSEKAVNAIKDAFPEVKVHDDDENGGGYMLFKLNCLLTYELVMETQAKATALVAEYGGRCESWGILHK